MVTKEQVLGMNKGMMLQAYSGKVGCMCGCRGNHRYSKACSLEAATKDRGYAVSANEISDNLVTRVLKVLKENINNVTFGDNNAYFEKGDRCWCVYPIEVK